MLRYSCPEGSSVRKYRARAKSFSPFTSCCRWVSLLTCSSTCWVVMFGEPKLAYMVPPIPARG